MSKAIAIPLTDTDLATGSQPAALRMNTHGDGTVSASVMSNNVITKLFDEFDSYVPVTDVSAALKTSRWLQTLGAGDIVVPDGNSLGSRYLDISKNPLVQDTATVIESLTKFQLPTELRLGLHMSQRVLGQEMSVEIVDDGALTPAIADVALSALSQATTTLTGTTVTPHGLVVGQSVGLRGYADSRANYPALVIASTPTPLTFTMTAGPGGTIPSLTFGPLSGGSLYIRERLGRSQEGSSLIFENTTATNGSIYIKSRSSEMPSGTGNGNHSVTLGSTVSTQALAAAFAYTFQPTTEFKAFIQSDRVQWGDVGVDSQNQYNSRVNRTQISPSPLQPYKLRIRAVNNESLTIPVGKIVSATKAGSTTATIVFAAPHGLTINDQIVIYGIRDQTNFANLTTATNVASVVDASTITIAFGGSFTGASYGGYVSRVQGSSVQNGAVTQAISTATLTGGILTLVGNVAWTGLVIGDYVNVHGCRIDLTGADRAVDGAWKIADITTTTLTLTPLTGTSVPADFVVGNCGGAIIKRTCLRLSYVHVLDYTRARVEPIPRAINDVAGANPVNVQNSLTIGSLPTLANVTTLATVTNVVTAGMPPVPTTPYFLNSAASTNGALIITGTSGVKDIHITNNGAAVAYVKLYNKATAPVVGTDVPEMIITVPATVSGVLGEKSLPGGYHGYRFPLGLGIAITGLLADTDTTAVAAGQVKVKLNRTV